MTRMSSRTLSISDADAVRAINTWVVSSPFAISVALELIAGLNDEDKALTLMRMACWFFTKDSTVKETMAHANRTRAIRCIPHAILVLFIFFVCCRYYYFNVHPRSAVTGLQQGQR
mmetsp:Transcript_10645/g.22893  ORF Transcript_10645/g.22893 Transcript_10645/m.22893 type:complete len:116 (+) Transcript_10645:1163-1510(+)